MSRDTTAWLLLASGFVYLCCDDLLIAVRVAPYRAMMDIGFIVIIVTSLPYIDFTLSVIHNSVR
jgi:hypothetical protein